MRKQILFLSIFLSVYGIEIIAQCTTIASNNQEIICGDSVQLNVETNWFTLNSGVTKDLRCVYFVNSKTGYAIGVGLVLKTVDGGTNWTQQIINQPVSLLSVFFTSETTGYISGGSGTILKTTDGGQNWIQQTTGTTSGLFSIYFTSTDVGYAVGSAGTILKTTDGGLNWTLQTSGITSNLRSIHFTDANIGYTVGDGVILKTTNGGTLWTTTNTNTNPNTNQTFGSVSFPDTNNGYVRFRNVISSIFYKTIDGGNQWQQIRFSPNPSFENSMFNSMYFTSAQTGYIVGGSMSPSTSMPSTYEIYKTTDGGLSWISQVKEYYRGSGSSNLFNSVCFTDSLTGFAVGGSGKIMKLSKADSYSWTPSVGLSATNIANPKASPTVTTTYTVTTIKGGCSSSAQVIVTVNPLTADAGADKSLVCGSSVQLDNVISNYNGTDKLRYKWTPATGLSNDSIANPTTTVTNDITYTVNVTTPNGCIATDDVKVTVIPLTANAGADKTVICGSSVQLDNVITNLIGTGELRYKWTPAIGLNNDSIANPIATVINDITYTVTVTTPNGCTGTDDIKVTVNPLTANAGVDKSIICGGTVKLNSVTTNYTGTGTLKYKWTPTIGLNNDSIANPTATVINDVTYTVTVTTPNGCTVTDDIKVTVNPLTANAGVDKTVICGSSVQLDNVSTNYTGTGTLKYKWTPAIGLNNDSIANPISTVINDITYTVTVTTPNGCTGTDSIKVTVNPLTANAGVDKSIICGETVQLNSVTTNYIGTGILKYKWTPATGLNNDTITNPTTTAASDITYTLTVTTPNGCTATDDIKLIVKPLTTNAGTDKTIICGGTTQLMSLTTNYTGTGILKYKWTPSTGLNNDSIANPTATVTSDITYTITVTTPNGCTASDNLKVIVKPLTSNAGIDKTIICGGTTQLFVQTTNYTGSGILKYKWTPSTGLNNDSIANPVATITSDITYTLTITTPNGCTSTDNIKVIVNPLTTNAGIDKTIICGGTTSLIRTTTNYTGTGILKYKWTPSTGLINDSSAIQTATVINDITYTVTVTTPNGCTATDEVSVIIIPMTKPEIGMVGVSSNNKNLIAWNKPVSTGIESYYIYRETNVTNVYEKISAVPYDSLSIYIDNQSLPDVQSNKYKLSIYDRHGLESSQSNSHKTMHLAINKGIGNAWNLSWETYEGFVVSTYNIYRGTTTANFTLIGSTSGSNTQYNDLNAPSGDIYYQLEVISPNIVNPTKVQSSQKIKVEDNGFSNSLISYSSSRSNIATNVISGINELVENNKIKIYPNPINNELRIVFEGGSTFEILNLVGQVVYNGNLIKSTFVNTSHFSSGIYLIRFKTGNTFEYKKIIKE